MDVKKVFRGISKKLSTDFAISAQINHNVSKGDYRESSLRKFLSEERLPLKYGVGHGEIVGHLQNSVSKQSDLIIFDRLNSIPLLYDEQTQVYPIDSIYGTIEVKSKLTKNVLFEALENIKSVKSLAPEDEITYKSLLFESKHKRPIPFGIIFAYSLESSSLESLSKNLKEWEQENSSKYWPNIIVILEEGVIYHNKKDHFTKVIKSEEINDECQPTYLAYREDTFLHFYSTLLDLCNTMFLPELKLLKYLDLPHQSGKYVVKNNGRIVRFDVDGKTDRTRVYRLNEAFIDKMVSWCREAGKITCKEMYLKEHGTIPTGLNAEQLQSKVYFYNPDNLPGFHEVKNPIKKDKQGRPIITQKLLVPSNCIVVDDEVYYYPMAYVESEDLEVIAGETVDDL